MTDLSYRQNKAYEMSPEFHQAVDDRIRHILRSELADYLPTGSILPSQIQGITEEGLEAADGDTLKYNALTQRMEVSP